MNWSLASVFPSMAGCGNKTETIPNRPRDLRAFKFYLASLMYAQPGSGRVVVTRPLGSFRFLAVCEWRHGCLRRQENQRTPGSSCTGILPFHLDLHYRSGRHAMRETNRSLPNRMERKPRTLVRALSLAPPVDFATDVYPCARRFRPTSKVVHSNTRGQLCAEQGGTVSEGAPALHLILELLRPCKEVIGRKAACERFPLWVGTWDPTNCRLLEALGQLP